MPRNWDEAKLIAKIEHTPASRVGIEDAVIGKVGASRTYPIGETHLTTVAVGYDQYKINWIVLHVRKISTWDWKIV